MRSMKYVLATVLIFSLLLAACGGAGDGQDNQDNGALGTEALDNENLNGNTNGAESTGIATQGAGGPGLGTPAGTAEGTDIGGLATPQGTALGTAMATEPMATEAVMGTETPEAGAEGTPMGTAVGVTGTETPAVGMGDEQMFTNGILLSDLLGQPVVLDDGTADGSGSVQNTPSAGDGATGTGTPGTGGAGTTATGTPTAAGDTGATGTTETGTPSAGGVTSPGSVGTGTPGAGGVTAGTPSAGDIGVLAGDEVGVVDSVVVSADTCRVLYVLVNSNLDGRLIPVPLSVFFARGQTGAMNMPLTLSVGADMWSAAPGFEADALPDMNAAGWDADLDTYWSGYTTGGSASGTDTGGTSAGGAAQTTGTPGAAQTPGADDGAMTVAAGGAVRLTDATDLNVTNANGEDLGDIEDFVISLNNQEISYAILAVGGVLDLGEDLIPVPCERLTFQMEEGADTPTVVIDVDPALLEGAPTISEMPTAFDEGWDAEWQTYWDAQR